MKLSVVAAAALALMAGGAVAHAATEPVCGATSGGETTLATYQLQAGAPTTVDLGRSDGPHGLDIPVTITGCHLPADHLPPGFTERFFSGSTEFPQDQIRVERDLAAKHRLVVTLDVTRGSADPGTYRGNLDLDSAEAYGNALTIPVTITVEERPWYKVLIPSLAVALVGGFFLLWLQSGGTGNAPMPFPRWLWRLRTWVAIGFGIAGAVGVWWKRYLDASTWTFSEFTSLITVMVVAFTGAAAIAVGAASVGTAAQQSEKLKKGKEGNRSETDSTAPASEGSQTPADEVQPSELPGTRSDT